MSGTHRLWSGAFQRVETWPIRGPDEAIRAVEDKSRILACQERIVANALGLGESGVRAIVAEGIYGVGSLDKPVPVEGSQFAPPNKLRAAEILAAHSDLAVYGFELKPLNDFGMAVFQQLGSSAARAREIGNDGLGISNPSKDEEISRLIQDESTRLNLWYAGLVPERSFLALQTALAVALARRENTGATDYWQGALERFGLRGESSPRRATAPDAVSVRVALKAAKSQPERTWRHNPARLNLCCTCEHPPCN